MLDEMILSYYFLLHFPFQMRKLLSPFSISIILTLDFLLAPTLNIVSCDAFSKLTKLFDFNLTISFLPPSTMIPIQFGRRTTPPDHLNGQILDKNITRRHTVISRLNSCNSNRLQVRVILVSDLTRNVCP